MVFFVRVLLWTLVRLSILVSLLCVVKYRTAGNYCVAYREDSRIHTRPTPWHYLPSRWYVFLASLPSVF